ncbi:uncharacterized protein LOC126427336 isoform X4 [Schistocerca serialis cubense]|uniref:uncharacterized protein LOC126427336 isoform X4 n=1 Tax=Schistocerca serialis cubense TaxID=2023355 RepID=UPI00214DFCB7|nr:uncharacterized protein LOC126427336 isoform X4 [Schistocerca serialis cubense]
MILTCCHLVVLKKFACYIFQICISAAMDQKPPVWMKKEETDEVPAEPVSMFPEDPVIIEEPSVGVKQDSELKHVDGSDFHVATSTKYASNSERCAASCQIFTPTTKSPATPLAGQRGEEEYSCEDILHSSSQHTSVIDCQQGSKKSKKGKLFCPSQT